MEPYSSILGISRELLTPMAIPSKSGCSSVDDVKCLTISPSVNFSKFALSGFRCADGCTSKYASLDGVPTVECAFITTVSLSVAPFVSDTYKFAFFITVVKSFV